MRPIRLALLAVLALASSSADAQPSGIKRVGFLGPGMSYGPSMTEMFRGLASYVDRVLKGTKPEELPVARPATFELVINLKTAKALGVTISPEILGRADAPTK
jgi:putative tryptophan/tyrosine transport system substrate-binding protein